MQGGEVVWLDISIGFLLGLFFSNGGSSDRVVLRARTKPKSASSPGFARINSYLNNSYLSQLERGSYRNRFCAVRAAVPVVPLVCAVSTSRIDTEVLIDCLAAYLGPPMSWPSWL